MLLDGPEAPVIWLVGRYRRVVATNDLISTNIDETQREKIIQIIIGMFKRLNVHK